MVQETPHRPAPPHQLERAQSPWPLGQATHWAADMAESSCGLIPSCPTPSSDNKATVASCCRPALSDEEVAGPALAKVQEYATLASETTSEKTREDLTGKLAAFTSMAEGYFNVPEAQRKHIDKGVHTLWLSQGTSVDALLLFVFVAWLRAIIDCDLIAIVLCGVSCAWETLAGSASSTPSSSTSYNGQGETSSRACAWRPRRPASAPRSHPGVPRGPHQVLRVQDVSQRRCSLSQAEDQHEPSSWGTNSMSKVASQAPTAKSVGNFATGLSTAVEDAQRFHDHDFARASRSSR